MSVKLCSMCLYMTAWQLILSDKNTLLSQLHMDDLVGLTQSHGYSLLFLDILLPSSTFHFDPVKINLQLRSETFRPSIVFHLLAIQFHFKQNFKPQIGKGGSHVGKRVGNLAQCIYLSSINSFAPMSTFVRTWAWARTLTYLVSHPLCRERILLLLILIRLELWQAAFYIRHRKKAEEFLLSWYQKNIANFLCSKLNVKLLSWRLRPHQELSSTFSRTHRKKNSNFHPAPRNFSCKTTSAHPIFKNTRVNHRQNEERNNFRYEV